MRISVWSSGVCSSDLHGKDLLSNRTFRRRLDQWFVHGNGSDTADGESLGALLESQVSIEPVAAARAVECRLDDPATAQPPLDVPPQRSPGPAAQPSRLHIAQGDPEPMSGV